MLRVSLSSLIGEDFHRAESLMGQPLGLLISVALLPAVVSAGCLLVLYIAVSRHRQKRDLSHYRILVHEAPVAIAMFDLEMRYLAASNRWAHGRSLDSRLLVGRSHYDVFPELPDRWRKVHQRCLAGAVESCEEEAVLHSSGKPQWVRWEVRPWHYRGVRKQIGGIIIFSEDITARHAAETSARELAAKGKLEKALRVETERANRSKDQFIATLSHELRTPLNSMLGWVEVARRSNGDLEKLSRAIAAIGRAARAQAQLISDILDVNRISAGKLRLDISLVSLDEFLLRALETSMPEAQAKDVSLKRLPGSEAVTVRGDPGRLEQCLGNLLTNAIKFSEAGSSVQVSAAARGDSVEISVRDSGQGIDPALLSSVFDRYTQADSSSTRVHGGLGLGLAIVKHLVELHGGRVWALSAGLGKGSEFVISLPRAKVGEGRPTLDGAPSSSLAAANLKGISVIVVDDHVDARELLRGLLEDHGAKVFTAGSADAALELVRSEKADLIISDIGMPHRDGCDFIREVRAIPSSLPALALTSYAAKKDANRVLAAGFTMHMAKPAAPAEILGAVIRLVNGSSADVGSSSPLTMNKNAS